MLATIFGLVIIEQQWESIGLFSSDPALKISLIPSLLLCVGAVITVASYLSYMRVRFGIWCFIPPGFSEILHNREESLSMKSMVITVIIQCLSMIPVFFLVYHIMTDLDLGKSVEFFRIEYLFLLLVCVILWSMGFIIFGYFYGKSKKSMGESRSIPSRRKLLRF